jgi:hypothetical protein
MLRSGRASTRLDDLSMAVNRYTWPSEEAGKGPTRSTYTRENLRTKWRGVELLAACGPFHACTAGSLGTWLPLFANNLPEQCSRSGSPDPHVFGPPGSGSISQRYGSGSGSTCFWTSRIRILLSSSKNSKKNLDFFCLVTSFGLFIFVK